MGWDDVAKVGFPLYGAFDTEYDTVTQGPLESPQQRAARQMLMEYANTGKVGDIKAGQDLGVKLGDYEMAGTERTGLNQLNQLMASGNPEMYGVANQGIRDMMDTSAAGLDTMFQPYKVLAEREGRDANDALKRMAGVTGNLYSTDTIRKQGDVATRTAESNMARLSDLMNSALNRKMTATGLAQQAGSLEESTKRNRIQDAMTLGARERELSNQKVQAEYQEKLRRRSEIMGQLDAASSVSGAPVQFGVESMKVAKPNPYMDLIQLIVSGGSRLAGSGAGA
jgi:hypothetical protein